jgi:hypothetical protein
MIHCLLEAYVERIPSKYIVAMVLIASLLNHNSILRLILLPLIGAC